MFNNCRNPLFYPWSPNYCEPTLSSTFFCKTASSPFLENLIKSLISQYKCKGCGTENITLCIFIKFLQTPKAFLPKLMVWKKLISVYLPISFFVIIPSVSSHDRDLTTKYCLQNLVSSLQPEPQLITSSGNWLK